ncbi:MAG TPA: hypothetical protein VNM47_02270 [Terriglobia bacterium]|nr:hypothetical protein [Terriglobia bacterium]
MVHAQRIIDDTLLNHPANTKGGQASEQETPNLELQEAIRKIILDAAVPAFDRRRRIRDLIKKELVSPQEGFLCQAADGRAFYFHKPERRLYDLEQKQFQHLLSSISDLSATESQFRFVLDSFQTEAARTKAVDVHTLSFYDLQTGRLVVSDGAGGVWTRARRGKWESGHNGDDGLLFLTDSDGKPWTPEFKQDGALAWFLNQLLLDNDPSLTPDQQRTLLTVWLLQNFFPALRRTRVIPAFLGPQGSGKTSTMRMIGALLCGAQFDVTGLSRDREDAFVAAVSNRVIVGLDNADSRIPWLEDSLATYATGLRYRLRRLYTTNEEVSYSPRAILMLSSRDPHFRRPDVAERLLPLHFKRPEKYQPESALFGGLVERRGRIIGELLLWAGAIADCLGNVTLPALQFRMADFASFGWAVASSAGQEAEWLDLLGKLERGQIEFASEGDSLVMVLRGILESDGVIEPIDVGSLYKKCSALAEDESLPFPKSAQGFGRHLTNMRRVVEIELNAVVKEERGAGNRRYVSIRPR